MRHYPGWSRVSIAALVMVCVARAGVDFTPSTVTREFDGVKLTSVVFRDGPQKINYNPPPNWRLSGAGPKLTLVSDSVSTADAQVEVKPIGTPVAIGQATLPQYSAMAQQSVPRTAKNLAIIGSQINPLRICGYDTVAIDLQYDAFGSVYQSKVIYLNRDHDQWVFKFTAPSNSFKEAFEPFRASLYSLTGL